MIIHWRLSRCGNTARPLQKITSPYRALTRSLETVKQRQMHTNSDCFKVSEEIQDAVRSKKPVVALESTIYTHGFPYPDNLALASHLESLVRTNGGIPATIGVVNGVARVGLSPEELITLASRKKDTMKVSRRDLSFICGLGVAGNQINGGTTVAGTIVLAHLAGIKVFATGGLGGVHRAGESSMDISSDLMELGRTPVNVISSGCKSFLDIPRTLEYLETQGVGVATFRDGVSGDVEFPAFWSRHSGVKSPAVLEDERGAAALIYAQSSLGLSSGLLLANPIPLNSSIPRAEMDKVITTAVSNAEAQGITGHAQTPFILAMIKDLTKGRSVEANKSLVSNNVIRGTKVAVALAELEQSNSPKLYGGFQSQYTHPRHQNTAGTSTYNNADTVRSLESTETISPASLSNDIKPVDVLVAGSLVVDLSCDYKVATSSPTAESPQLHTSNPGIIAQSVGGVGYNVAKAVHLMGIAVRLCSAVGDDLSGKTVLGTLVDLGMDREGITVSSDASRRTGHYVAINDGKKDLFVAMADMSILEDPKVDFGKVWQTQIDKARPKWLVLDSTWHAAILRKWILAGQSAGARIAFEPVSTAKSARLFVPLSASEADMIGIFPNHNVNLTTPNTFELSAMHTAAQDSGHFDRQGWWRIVDALGISSAGARSRLVAMTNADLVDQGIPQMTTKLLPFIPCIFAKLGAQGVLMTELLRPDDWRLTNPDAAEYILSRSDGHDEVGGVYMRLFPPAEVVPQNEIVSVNGVGDTFLGVLLAGLVRGEDSIRELVNRAQMGSVMTLKSRETVNPELGRLRYD